MNPLFFAFDIFSLVLQPAQEDAQCPRSQCSSIVFYDTNYCRQLAYIISSLFCFYQTDDSIHHIDSFVV
jgi:hypothetical protein